MKAVLNILMMLLLSNPVFGVPYDKDDIRPLKNPVEIKSGFPRWLAVFFALVIIAGVLTWVYFRRKKTVIAKSVLPPRPPEEIAFEELNALAGMRLVEEGLVKEYYIRISDIIRRYIEARYNIGAIDRTTWELYQEMRIKRIESQHSDMIRDFLEECDLVKFAKYIPGQREIEEIYKKAKEIVRLTTPT
jgi:predicted CopG family antitoxin